MITLNDYNVDGGEGESGFLGDQGTGEASLLKAMQAGQITGRDTTNLPLTQEPLKVESLEESFKLLENRAKDIKLLNAMPKMTAYNTVEEFLQLVSYGAQRGGFYDEGELSDVEDSTYERRSVQVKYMQVTGEVTLQAQMVRSYVKAMSQEVKNKMMWITRLANTWMTRGDSSVIPQQFDGIFKQHESVGSGTGYLYSTYEQYYQSGSVIDLRGGIMNQASIENGAVFVDEAFGDVTDIFAPTGVISAFTQDYYTTQRILQNGTAFNGTIGVGNMKSVSTTIGDVNLNSDKMMKRGPLKYTTTPADSTKAPAAPASLTASVVADTVAKFTSGEAGNVFYAVVAVNRYGESNLTAYGTAVTLAAGFSVDLTITPGSGAIAPSGYNIYRTKVTTASTPSGLKFYPIQKVSVSQLAAGFNGAAANVARDRGYFMPGTEDGFLTAFNDEVLSWKQLAPLSKLDLAVLSMSRRFICFMFGTPALYAIKKIVRFINAKSTNAVDN